MYPHFKQNRHPLMKNDYHLYLQSLSKEELIDIIYKKVRPSKPLQYKSTRHIVLRISYMGAEYSGLAPSKKSNSIGNYIENALKSTGLGDKVVYAGRTDAGVSAINMIASIIVKSRLDNQKNQYEKTEDDKFEFKYDSMLNNVLPNNIKVIGWAPTPEDFSARFTCTQRQYRYYFEKGNLNIVKMQEMKNFYDLSKHSNPNAKYERSLDVCEIVKGEDLYYLDIRAKSFLHNMVRKIFFAVEQAGRGEEVDFKNIGLTSPLNLVFIKAVYPHELNFICNGSHVGRLYDDMVDSKVIYQIKKDMYEFYK